MALSGSNPVVSIIIGRGRFGFAGRRPFSLPFLEEVGFLRRCTGAVGIVIIADRSSSRSGIVVCRTRICLGELICTVAVDIIIALVLLILWVGFPVLVGNIIQFG